MLNVVKNILQIKNLVKGFVSCLCFLGGHAFAALPQLEDPSQGKQSGIMANMQAYIYDGFVFGGLLIVGVMLVVAAKNAIVEYNNIGDGKGSWAKLAALVVIGVSLIVACIWLASLAAETLMN